jgi:hypothetical protein
MSRCADAIDLRRREMGTNRSLPVIRPRTHCSLAPNADSGGTRGVGHGPSNGRRSGRRDCRGRSRTMVTGRATMSDRPRAGTHSAGLICSSSPRQIASRPIGRRFRLSREKARRALRPRARRVPPQRSGPREGRGVAATVGLGGFLANKEVAASGRLGSVPGWRRAPGQGRSCDRAIRARRPSREAADAPADQSLPLRWRPAGDLQPR